MKLEEFRALLSEQPPAPEPPIPLPPGYIWVRPGSALRIDPWPEAPPGALCQRCERPGATRIPSMTAYEWNGKGDDPNEPPILCDLCGAQYTEYWQGMWDDYHSGLL